MKYGNLLVVGVCVLILVGCGMAGADGVGLAPATGPATSTTAATSQAATRKSGKSAEGLVGPFVLHETEGGFIGGVTRFLVISNEAGALASVKKLGAARSEEIYVVPSAKVLEMVAKLKEGGILGMKSAKPPAGSADVRTIRLMGFDGGWEGRSVLYDTSEGDSLMKMNAAVEEVRKTAAEVGKKVGRDGAEVGPKE